MALILELAAASWAAALAPGWDARAAEQQWQQAMSTVALALHYVALPEHADNTQEAVSLPVESGEHMMEMLAVRGTYAGDSQQLRAEAPECQQAAAAVC